MREGGEKREGLDFQPITAEIYSARFTRRTRRPRREIFAPAFACVIRLDAASYEVLSLFRASFALYYIREGGWNSFYYIYRVYFFVVFIRSVCLGF